MSVWYGPIHDYEPHQEEDLVASASLWRTGIVAILVGAIGIFFAGVIVVAATGYLVPPVAGPQGTQPAPHQIGEIEQTPIWQTQRGIDLRNEQRHALDRWGWVDRDHRVARIPIDEAMNLVVQQQGATR